VFRKGDDFVIITELPGINKSDLDIQVKDNAIRIAGTKTVNHTDKASLHRRERAAGRFDRAVTIPVRIDADRVKAEYSRTHGPVMEVTMASSQELSVQQKKELAPKEEKTVPARYFFPNTDIYETEEALTLVMEIPGVEKGRQRAIGE
jgi:HSP20 family molecular chaperone IbpA